MRKKTKQLLLFYKTILEKCYDWLFDEITRPIEVLSSIGMIMFSTVFLIYNAELIKLPSYAPFKYVAPPQLWLIFIAIGLVQVLATIITSIKANKVSGYFLMLSGAVWGWIAITFSMGDLGIITTAPSTYWLLAIFCSLAGKRLLDKNKKDEDKPEDEVR